MPESQLHNKIKQSVNRQKNIFLLGSKEEHAILKEWAENHSKNRFHLNGWFHDKDIPASALELIDEYNEMAKEGKVDHFVLDPSDMDHAMLQASIDWAESRGSRIHLIQSGTSSVISKLDKLNRFGPFAAVPLRQEPLSFRRNQLIKSMFDKGFALVVAITILWWFIPLIGLLIKLNNSKGPVLIQQDRIGFNGQKYKCFKFRTMISDKNAEKGYGVITKENDRRITLIGKFLRKSNLDELPQFLNVLKGDMSIIGPRPNPIKEDEEISDKIEKYRIRRFVKPGITGYAAVKGFRGSTFNMDLMQKRIDIDIDYIENWSLFLDIKIFFMTIWQMLTFSTGAR